MTSAVSSAFAQFAKFSGRATRAEYWFFVLFVILGTIALSFVDVAMGTPLSAIFSLVCFLPSLAVLVRRLHDTGHSGWWFLISLIPLIGTIWLLVLLASRGDSAANAYGPASA